MTRYLSKNNEGIKSKKLNVAIKIVSLDIIKFIFIGILFFMATRWFFAIISTIGDTIIPHSWADRGFFFFLFVILPFLGIIWLSSSKRGNLFKRRPILAITLGILIIMIIIFNYSPEDIARADLEDYGYEVINIGLLDDTAYVEMKSLGNRNNQVWKGASALFFYLDKNASEYKIKIISEKEECWYKIDGDIYRAYMMSKDYENYINYINSQIESGTCS